MNTVLKKLSIVIPCYNEELAIPTLLPRLEKSLQSLLKKDLIESFELIVVNDKSTDRTLELLRQFKNIKVINTSGKKRGYGLALKQGFIQAKGQWVAFLDMDNTYHPEDLEKLVKASDEFQNDFIMGTRSYSAKGMSITRGLGNWLYVTLAKALYGSELKDVCSGFRLFHNKYKNEIIQIQEDGLDFSIYLTLKMLSNKVSIKQVPIQYDVRLGPSKLSIFSDGIAFLKVFYKIKMRQVRGLKHSRV